MNVRALLLALALCQTGFAAQVEGPKGQAPLPLPPGLPAPALASPAADGAGSTPAFLPAAPTGAASVFDGSRLRADSSDAEIAAAGDALYRRYAPALYAPVPVSTGHDETPVAGAAAHSWTPKTGHSIVFLDPAPDSPNVVDPQGRVFTSFGEQEKVRVQHKLERLLAYVHEYAHAVFGELAGNLEERSLDAVYNAVTEGFAVTVERRVMDGMLRDASKLKLSPADAADVAAMRRERQRWLRREPTYYTEGRHRIMAAVERRGGDAAVRALAESLDAKTLLALRRQDLAYQLSHDQPERLAAVLAGRPAPVGELLETAPKSTLRRFFSLFLSAGETMDLPDGGKVAYKQRWLRELTPQLLFSTVAQSPRARRELARYLARAARRGELDRVFESPGFPPEVLARVAFISAEAEKLPFSPRERKDWTEALARWLVRNPPV